MQDTAGLILPSIDVMTLINPASRYIAETIAKIPIPACNIFSPASRSMSAKAATATKIPANLSTSPITFSIFIESILTKASTIKYIAATIANIPIPAPAA